MSNTALKNQVFLYSVDTSFFYTKEEREQHDVIMELTLQKIEIKKERKKYKDKKSDEYKKLTSDMKPINKKLKDLKSKLSSTLASHKGIRTLNPEFLTDKRKISLFESSLTRISNFEVSKHTSDLMVVQIYHYEILKSIIHNGFLFNGEKYRYYSSSAGQIRTKKIVAIKESLFNRIENTLTCGLSEKMINNTVINKERNEVGINPNKYQAYLALTNSASVKWEGFDINKSIVVSDMETEVFGEVDHINTVTFEIERKEMSIPIPHTDGCGMMLPKVSEKAFMYRLPFHKGLLVPFPFDKFALEHGQTKVTDIYGKQYDIIDDDIQVIFTESQFKMWKYYSSWNEYKENFVKYNCEAVRLNEENISDNNANLNYQMLQTLTEVSMEELESLAAKTNYTIEKMATDKRVKLKSLGVTPNNPNKNYLQKSIDMYHELLNDPHTKQMLREIKSSKVKDAKAGKIEVNGRYTFLIPDLYAFCEFLLLGVKQPEGLLKNKEVYCKIEGVISEGKVDVLRSPHLYREHGIRNNVINDEFSKWFITQGIYTSVHDNISRILQFDKSHCRLT